MVQERTQIPDEQTKLIYDELSEKVYQVQPETRADAIAAFASAAYLLVMLGLFFWQLFDVWIGQFTLARWVGYDTNSIASPTFRLVAYTFIGGGLGGIVNGIRSILFWHCEKYVFGVRFIWKYITAPWIGTTLALFTYALIHSGIAVFGGDISTNATSSRQMLAMFATGVLAGYGSREAFIWLDAQVKKIFKVASGLKVPDLTGKTKDEAEGSLRALNLSLGKVLEEPREDESMVGKIISQSPLPESPIMSGGKIDVTIGIKKTP